jgi:hypothetical protein
VCSDNRFYEFISWLRAQNAAREAAAVTVARQLERLPGKLTAGRPGWASCVIQSRDSITPEGQCEAFTVRERTPQWPQLCSASCKVAATAASSPGQ